MVEKVVEVAMKEEMGMEVGVEDTNYILGHSLASYLCQSATTTFSARCFAIHIHIHSTVQTAK